MQSIEIYNYMKRAIKSQQDLAAVNILGIKNDYKNASGRDPRRRNKGSNC